MIDTLLAWLAQRLPKRLIYWTLIHAGAVVTTGKWGTTIVPELTYMEALKRWDEQ